MARPYEFPWPQAGRVLLPDQSHTGAVGTAQEELQGVTPTGSQPFGFEPDDIADIVAQAGINIFLGGDNAARRPHTAVGQFADLGKTVFRIVMRELRTAHAPDIIFVVGVVI